MSEIKRLAVVVASTHTPDEKKDYIESIKKTCGYGCNIIYNINQNETPLTTIYNKAFNEADADYYIFVHDDVEFLRNGWGAEIIRLFNEHKEYGIIGVAGSAVYDKMENKEQGAWWRYNDIYGQVLHRNNGQTWLTTFSPLIKEDLKEVVLVDGLFIAVAKDRIYKQFDEDFKGFNHYDTSFCISNFISKKCKIGVTTNIRLAHNSIGEMKPNWYDNLKLLNDKYGVYFPLKVKK